MSVFWQSVQGLHELSIKVAVSIMLSINGQCAILDKRRSKPHEQVIRKRIHFKIGICSEVRLRGKS